VEGRSLGKKKNPGCGKHFQWDSANIKYNVLYAVGYVGGRPVAKDCIILHHLPKPPHYASLIEDKGLLQPAAGYSYVYRVNCGGPDYTDGLGHLWKADEGSHSWTNDYPGLPPYFASQRRTFDPVAGTADWPLFQDFRFGLDKLGYTFPVQDGDYMVELYFVEPWYGRGGGMDCTGWRLFDIAVNDSIVARDIDIWKAAGYSRALKKTFRVHVTGGRLVIGFPKAAAGQALISAIAIATRDKTVKASIHSRGLISQLVVKETKERHRWSIQSWMDTGVPEYSDDSVCFSSLPPELYGAEWVRGPKGVHAGAAIFRLSAAADVYVMDRQGVRKQRWPAGSKIGLDGRTVAVCPVDDLETAFDQKPMTTYKAANARWSGDTLEWDVSTGVADKYSLTVKYCWLGAMPVAGKLVISLENGTLIREEAVTFGTTRAGKWNYLETSTGTMINAGRYKVRLVGAGREGLKVDALQMQ
jgi:beta-galactosidase